MWRDESVTYQVAHRSLGDLWALLGRIDAVHGLYYLLMHGVFALWDGGLVALRLPSVAATALAAAGVGAIGHRLAGARAGLSAGLVFAVLPVVQEFAQEGRSYALVCAGVTWATYAFLRALDTGRARWWTAYALLLALACWLHEFAGLALLAHGLTLWRQRVPRATWRRWGAAAAGVAVSVLPLALFSAGQSERQLGWLGRPGVALWLQFLTISAAGALLAWLLTRRSGGASRRLVTLALPMLVAPAGLLMVVSLVKPWYVERYVLYGMTGLALLAGAALDRAIAHRDRLVPATRALTACLLAAAAVAVLLPWSSLVRSPESRKDDVVAVAHAVEKAARPGDGVLFMPARRREWLMSFPDVYARVDDLALAGSPTASDTLQGTELPADGLRRRLLAADRVIALTDPPGQPLDPFPQEVVKRRVLKTSFQVCDRTAVRGAQIIVYARRC
ncbi:glycosyltransferase family 39 protein [Streptomyces sp. S.PNR 29]|uniref:glycosyltransferase family 39 protein n=1 Tax=Streptomyces sp. S.PNR 29 TaxID=2973805 RepID=UPI0025B239CF|nr:glycosyltransferase family 39 protein [Streptomyces sp. S.PNR 29]MDN0194525.1 glycosyltransferase family 39 protein [Streptomyces sp. S.PNR 29]